MSTNTLTKIHDFTEKFELIVGQFVDVAHLPDVITLTARGGLCSFHMSLKPAQARELAAELVRRARALEAVADPRVAA